MKPKMKSYQVDLGDRSYPIHIGPCLSDQSLLQATLSQHEILIVTNDTIAPLYLERIMAPLRASGKKIAAVILPDGEQYKDLATLNRIFDELLAQNFSRKVVLVALGGGVVGDMTGFAAASYQRGVDFVQIPTTLLAQVDSSVGGKTGVNHALGKNMIGAFKQPLAVFIDPSTLLTLPKNEFAAGFAEVIKHGVIQGADYFAMLETRLTQIFALDMAALTDVISGSCAIKAHVVAQDETEQGLRAILNFGHTFGHAIETTMGYGRWLHGEAVGVGMVMATDMSRRLGLIEPQLAQRIVDLVEQAGLPIRVPEQMTVASFMTAIDRDKKVDAGTLRLVLVRALGDGFLTADFDPALLKDTLASFCRG
jgi:3-dehydroquinate synthase